MYKSVTRICVLTSVASIPSDFVHKIVCISQLVVRLIALLYSAYVTVSLAWHPTNAAAACCLLHLLPCGIKLEDRLPSKELRERLGVDDIAFVLQQNRLRWYGHVLRKDDDDWVKKCMEYEVEGPRHRGPGERLSKRTVKHVN